MAEKAAVCSSDSSDITSDKTKLDDQDDKDLFSTSSASTSPVQQKDPLDFVVDANDNEDLFSAPCESSTKGDAVDRDGSKKTKTSNVDLNTAAVLPSATEIKYSSDSSDVAAAVAAKAGDALMSDEAEDSLNAIEILVSDPKKIGDGMGAYVVYRVTTRTNIKHFKSPELVVTRRFSDFLGLHEKLVNRYQSRGIIVPPPPEKSVVGMTKIKVMKEETGSMEFVEKRRAALERFLNRVAKHPQLSCDSDFVDFVELDDELPKATSTAALSGAGFVRLLNRVGDSIGKYTYAMAETDEWFEDKSEQLEMIDRELQQVHASIEFLVINRKDLSTSTQQFAKSVAVLGSTEENMSLSRALSQLSEVETRIYQLQADQADTDFYVMSELIKDYVCVIHSIKEVLHERVKLHKLWKDAEAALAKKRDEHARLEQQRKVDKLVTVSQEITELEHRVSKCHEDFDEISATIKKEAARFEKQKVQDFKSTIINYLQCMMNYQQQIATCWESFLPEAKEIQ
jgi:sorting nexin-1/2